MHKKSFKSWQYRFCNLFATVFLKQDFLIFVSLNPAISKVFLLTSVKTCQLHKSMSVFAVKERVQVSQMSRHLLGIDGFFAMFFFAKS